MSNGIKHDYKSTIVAVYKAGAQVTTKSTEEPESIRKRYEEAFKFVDKGIKLKLETGDEDSTVGYLDLDGLAFFAVQNYASAEVLEQRAKTAHELALMRQQGSAQGAKSQPRSNIIVPRR